MDIEKSNKKGGLVMIFMVIFLVTVVLMALFTLAARKLDGYLSRNSNSVLPFLLLISGIFVIPVTGVTGCLHHAENLSAIETNARINQIQAMLDGEHSLRRMKEITKTSSEFSGGFFLIGGSISGSSQTETEVIFSWQLNDGTYVISSLPLHKIRVKFDEQITTPMISFNYSTKVFSHVYPNPDKLESFFGRSIQYAIVTINQEDWPIEINMPLA